MKYEIKGGEFPVVICSLSDGESMITERGSMVWQTPNIKMETRGGGVGKMFARAFSGDSMFQNIYTAQGDGVIAFGTSFPGRILPMRISPDNELVMQKRSFLASTPGVRLEVVFNKKLGAGLFGGEGFIMQRLSGEGLAFVEIDGDVFEMELAPGEQLIADTGNVAGFEASVQMDIRQVPGLKNKLLGGEGLFNTLLTGPGKVWLQTMPIAGVAAALMPYFPSGMKKSPGQSADWPGDFFKSHYVLFDFLAESLGVGGHGYGKADAFVFRKAVQPVEEVDGLGLCVAVKELVEVVYEYVGNVIIPGAKTADEALHELKSSYLVVAGINQSGLVGYIKREIPVLFDADDVTLLLAYGFAHELDELLRLAGPLQAHDNFDHVSHAPFYKVQHLLPTHGTYSLPFFRQECNM